MLVNSRTLRVSTSSGDSSASLKSGRARLGSERDRRRKYTRRERASLLVVAFLLNAISIGTDLSSGILYAKLLDSPCVETRLQSENTTDFLQRTNHGLDGVLTASRLSAHVNLSEGRMSGPTPHTKLYTTGGNASNESQRCGGFGKSASETGEPLLFFFLVNSRRKPIFVVLSHKFLAEYPQYGEKLTRERRL